MKILHLYRLLKHIHITHTHERERSQNYDDDEKVSAVLLSPLRFRRSSSCRKR